MTDRITRDRTVLWCVRWDIANALVWAAVKIAPRGPARDLFISTLNDMSEHVMRTIAQNKAVDKTSV